MVLGVSQLSPSLHEMGGMVFTSQHASELVNQMRSCLSLQVLAVEQDTGGDAHVHARGPQGSGHTAAYGIQCAYDVDAHGRQVPEHREMTMRSS